METESVRIIRKKVPSHKPHGGAWKVAYADFVTALMSLFIVLWLMNSSRPIQEAVGGYFRDPFGYPRKVSTGRGPADKILSPKENLAQLKQKLLKDLASVPEFAKLKNQIEITVTEEGLRIELIESSKGTFFENGRSQPTQALIDVLKVLAVEAGKLPNPVSLEGHTDSKPYSGSRIYSNWELSADRANAARRLMEQSGLRQGQVVAVRGYADRRLRKPDHPFDPSNRRVSILIQYMPDKVRQAAGDIPNVVRR